ncbi:hypothetical protein SAY87_029134 [Trapa incisa]|uniref:C2H2-type domain-containing protein n=1 Tax=Trapa incisa TaxID=236973 RepID=A0AAN7L360_9MYRT|nr:hypothetical protein SAY87_029134 [Trapa incisa]
MRSVSTGCCQLQITGLQIIELEQKRLSSEMSNLTSASITEASVSSSGNRTVETTGGGEGRGGGSSSMYPLEHHQPPHKKKRSLPGNPDPQAEVITLSPKSLMATNRFICEICNKGFQRDQNLQLHRRGHNLPWKLKQRPTSKELVRKKVYVCPEPTCVHHDPSRALGDLTGIKKHFSRKHGEKKWKCDKCSKRYAVLSDWKAHSKICGTREYRCDCGTLFSRRDSFITHRAFCDALAEESRSTTVAPTNISSTNPRQFLHHRAIPQPSSSSSNPNPNLHGSSFLSNLQIPAQFDSNISFLYSLKKEEETANRQQFVGLRQDLMMPAWIGSGHENPFSPQQPVFEDHAANANTTAGAPAMQYYQSPIPGGSMSATALLQKAAQMGHVHSEPGTSAPAGFGQPAISSPRSGFQVPPPPHLSAGAAGAGQTGPSISLMQEMMSSAGQMTGSSYGFSPSGGGGGGLAMHMMAGNEDLTRDFLGLRPLSQSEIFDIAGFGNCMSSPHDPQSQQSPAGQKPWQG